MLINDVIAGIVFMVVLDVALLWVSYNEIPIYESDTPNVNPHNQQPTNQNMLTKDTNEKC